eukprot:86746-Alexandrium_andersonii.AAC.1
MRKHCRDAHGVVANVVWPLEQEEVKSKMASMRSQAVAGRRALRQRKLEALDCMAWSGMHRL